MACLGIHQGGIGDCVIQKHDYDYLHQRSHGVSAGFKHIIVKIPNHTVCTAVACDSGRRSAFTLSDEGLDLQTKTTAGNSGNDEYNDRTSIDSPRVYEKLDDWMRNSVAEIVRNIKQAPLLVQIYAHGEMKTRKAVPEDWSEVAKHRSSLLEGVILVEELRENTDLEDSGDVFEEDDGTRAFGVVIQGKIKGKEECKSSCYLLKTSSVNGGLLGHNCTHFCLMKVQSFNRSAISQLNDSWLVY